MKDILKQQVVIMATLLGLSDDEISAGVTKCEQALERHGLTKKVGNPHIKTLAKTVEVSLIDELLETTKRLTVTSPTTVKFIYSMIADVEPDLTEKMTKWQCARLLTKLAETSDLVVKAVDRGQNVFTFIKGEESSDQIKKVMVEEKTPRSPDKDDDKFERARLKVQQADYYLRDIENHGESSIYYEGREDIMKTRNEALLIING